MPYGKGYTDTQNRVTTHGAKGKGTKGGPGKGMTKSCPVTTSNSRRYAFPSTGGMRRD